jgi:hypothetical protein
VGDSKSLPNRPQNAVGMSDLLADNVLHLCHLTCGVFEVAESCSRMVSYNRGPFMTFRNNSDPDACPFSGWRGGVCPGLASPRLAHPFRQPHRRLRIHIGGRHHNRPLTGTGFRPISYVAAALSRACLSVSTSRSPRHVPTPIRYLLHCGAATG